ncbi:MAG: DHH family phosphoesterase [Eubacteriales bacterium]|nr:DHH family phosphoesterase [Eubacteriales bacterium]
MDKVNVSEPQESVEETVDSTEKISASALIKKKKGRIYGYFRITLIMGIILWVTDLLILFLDGKSFAALSLVCLVYTVVMAAAFFNSRVIYRKEMAEYVREFLGLEDLLLKEMDMPYALLDEGGHLLWMNPAFEEAIHRDINYRRPVSTILPALTRDSFPRDYDKTVKVQAELVGNSYVAQMRRIRAAHLSGSAMMFGDSVEGDVIALCLVDNTAVQLALREIDDQSLAVGLFYIDNYDEVIDTVEEVRKALLIALIDRKVNQYISSMDGICSKIEKDKYLVIIRKKSLQGLLDTHFDILEDVKKVNIGNEMAVTLSLGFGLDGLAYTQNYEFARNAVDLALGRGGDQAVVKYPDNIVYYGGKTRQVEKNTRVKARVKAQALKEIIRARDDVFIMGHKLGDPDSFGAAVGIYRIARTLNKRAHIVINERTISLVQILGLFENNPEYEKDFIVTSAQAIEMVSDNSCVVVVDVNNPARTECPELLVRCKSVVVFDHHRAGKDVIDGATLSYVEGYASSACEMVAEIVQYTGENIRLRPEEADAIYGGIVVDTDSFVKNAGVRTFEAAAFLRRSGADVVRVRKLFREEAVEYKARADAVSQAEIYRDAFAISVCNGEGLRSPTVVGAQAANEMLNIDGIKASFVMTEYNGLIFVSARSIDEVNVQLVMEHMGGGGHINMAGSQMSNATVEEAIARVKEVIDQMIEDGEIEI